jgi:hypothetical protein
MLHIGNQVRTHGCSVRSVANIPTVLSRLQEEGGLQ